MNGCHFLDKKYSEASMAARSRDPQADAAPGVAGSRAQSLSDDAAAHAATCAVRSSPTIAAPGSLRGVLLAVH